jgi:hypothetical protein
MRTLACSHPWPHFGDPDVQGLATFLYIRFTHEQQARGQRWWTRQPVGFATPDAVHVEPQHRGRLRRHGHCMPAVRVSAMQVEAAGPIQLRPPHPPLALRRAHWAPWRSRWPAAGGE